MMDESVKLLLIEDSDDDALRVEHELRRAGYRLAAKRVQAANDMRRAIEADEWDVIISDFHLHGFDGLSALAIAHEKGRQTPFILISGIGGEEAAVTAMKAGAHDYILKSDLNRLGPAVERELREAQLRKNLGRAERARLASEAKYQALVENLPAITYISSLRDRPAPLYVSPQVEAILGFSASECIEDPGVWERQVYSEDRARVQHDVGESRRLGQPFAAEYRMLRRDGGLVWIHEEAEVVRDQSGNPIFLHGVMSDITARKSAEAELYQHRQALRTLTYELLVVEESERRRIATDIHDNVSQTLALCKIRMGALVKAVETNQPPPREVIDEIQTLLDRTIKQTRALSFELSPPVLYELGLAASLEWLADQFAKQYGIAVTYDVAPELKNTDLPIGILLFRAVNELLRNIGQHAAPNSVRLTAAIRGGMVDVVLIDDGVGFDVDAVRADVAEKRSLGLFSISERIEHIGGRLIIESSVGRGTTVTLQAPISAEDNNGNSYYLGG